MRRRDKPFRHRLRDFLVWRSRPLRGWARHLLIGPWRRLGIRLGRGPWRVHVGCGHQRLPGWINVDLQKLPEVDLAEDAVRALRRFRGRARAVFAEHFLEHLPADRALDFLVAARGALAPEGRLRLTTPNLDWVWETQYRLDAGRTARQEMAIAANRAFYGWRHRFLWNRELLERALLAAGLTDLAWPRRGESADPELSGLERHETYADAPDLPHVLVVEGRRGSVDAAELAALRDELERGLLRYDRP